MSTAVWSLLRAGLLHRQREEGGGEGGCRSRSPQTDARGGSRWCRRASLPAGSSRGPPAWCPWLHRLLEMRADSLTACPKLGSWKSPQHCHEGGHEITPCITTNPANSLPSAPGSSSTLHIPVWGAKGEPAPEQEQFSRKPRSLHSICL